MKKTLLYISLMAVVLVIGSCTRNHGDIGPWFATWHVESISAGGMPITVEGDYFFQFQSKVFRVSQVTGHENTVESFGTWDENSDKMTIDFPDPDVFYIVMPGLEAHNEFTVTTDNTGVIYTYYLKKQP